MNRRKGLAALAGLCLVAPGWALAQAQPAGAVYNSPAVAPAAGRVFPLQLDVNGNLKVTGTTTTGPLGVTSTQAGSTVTTHLTFQSALASSATRKGCLIVNTSADEEWVFFGATASATTSNSIPLPAGQNISCVSGNIVLTDNVAITSNATDGATFVKVSQ